MTPPDDPPPVPAARGLFVVLDGPDGGGKTTQVTALAAWLGTQGREVVTCRDPGGTPLGERLRSVLLDRDGLHPGLRCEMLLYMASRAQLVDEVIRPALEGGRVVLSDRFTLANIVYQGFAGGLEVEEIARVGLVSTGGLLPDMTLLLDVPLEVARARVARARDRMEDRPGDYHERVRQGYLRAVRDSERPGGAPYYPAPLTLIDATGDPADVAGRIRSEVGRALALGPRS